MYQPMNTSIDVQPTSKTPFCSILSKHHCWFLACLSGPSLWQRRSCTNKLFTFLLIWTCCQRKGMTKVRRLGNHCPRLYIPSIPGKGPLVTPQTNTSRNPPPKVGVQSRVRDLQSSPSELEKVAQHLFWSSFEYLQRWRSIATLG